MPNLIWPSEKAARRDTFIEFTRSLAEHHDFVPVYRSYGPDKGKLIGWSRVLRTRKPKP